MYIHVYIKHICRPLCLGCDMGSWHTLEPSLSLLLAGSFHSGLNSYKPNLSSYAKAHSKLSTRVQYMKPLTS